MRRLPGTLATVLMLLVAACAEAAPPQGPPVSNVGTPAVLDLAGVGFEVHQEPG